MKEVYGGGYEGGVEKTVVLEPTIGYSVVERQIEDMKV